MNDIINAHATGSLPKTQENSNVHSQDLAALHLGSSFQTPNDVPSFRLVGENCDLRVKTRKYPRTHGHEDMHLFLLLAVKNRVFGRTDSEFG